LKELASVSIKINHVKRYILKRRIEVHALPLYDYGFMDMQKQYATIGLNGINEAIEFLGYDILNEDGQDVCSNILDTINGLNDKADKQYKYAHNTEQTPSENSSIKLAQKDKLLKYQNTCELYSNQFIPLIKNADMLDRIKLQGIFDSKFSGGAICHINVETAISDIQKEEDLITTAIKMGVVYFALNYNLQKCKNNHMSVGLNKVCPICGEEITDNYTRVVGFYVNTKNFAPIRREYDYPNREFYESI
jgi:ribonucleoside-triphosphate reductase